VTDGTKEVASAIFYKQIKTLHLDFVSRSAGIQMRKTHRFPR
jgi:type VI secretion system protein VasD